jgi:hypothetical protein
MHLRILRTASVNVTTLVKAAGGYEGLLDLYRDPNCILKTLCVPSRHLSGELWERGGFLSAAIGPAYLPLIAIKKSKQK